jgi:hypothetical protein
MLQLFVTFSLLQRWYADSFVNEMGLKKKRTYCDTTPQRSKHVSVETEISIVGIRYLAPDSRNLTNRSLSVFRGDL